MCNNLPPASSEYTYQVFYYASADAASVTMHDRPHTQHQKHYKHVDEEECNICRISGAASSMVCAWIEPFVPVAKSRRVFMSRHVFRINARNVFLLQVKQLLVIPFLYFRVR